MFIYKYLKQKKLIEDLRTEIAQGNIKIEQLKTINEGKNTEINNLRHKNKLLESDSKSYYQQLDYSLKEFDKLQFIHELSKKQAEQEKEDMQNKISDLKHKGHQKVGAIGGLTRQNKKLRTEREQMLDLINKLIEENQHLKRSKKKITIEDIKKYFKIY